jgi:hypothetical protein
MSKRSKGSKVASPCGRSITATPTPRRPRRLWPKLHGTSRRCSASSSSTPVLAPGTTSGIRMSIASAQPSTRFPAADVRCAQSVPKRPGTRWDDQAARVDPRLRFVRAKPLHSTLVRTPPLACEPRGGSGPLIRTSRLYRDFAVAAAVPLNTRSTNALASGDSTRAQPNVHGPASTSRSVTARHPVRGLFPLQLWQSTATTQT